MGLFAQQYSIERALGRHHDLVPLLEATVRENPDVVAWAAGLARALVEAGRFDEGRAQLAAVVARLPSAPRNWSWIAALAVAAEASARLQDINAAAVVERLLAPYSGRLVVVASGTSCEGAVDRYLGLLAATRHDLAAANRWFDTAMTLEERTGAAVALVRTRLDCAAMLRRSGFPGAANAGRQLAESARDDAQRLGVVHEPALPA
jgi:hypothetical protein